MQFKWLICIWNALWTEIGLKKFIRIWHSPLLILNHLHPFLFCLYWRFRFLNCVVAKVMVFLASFKQSFFGLLYQGINFILHWHLSYCQYLILYSSDFTVHLTYRPLIHKGSLPNLAWSESIKFYSPWNHRKTYGFVTVLGGIEVN